MNEVRVNFKYVPPARALVEKRKRYKYWFGGRKKAPLKHNT